jgi:glycosyltransferase involved in cell wall biosynthesis
MRVAMPIGLYDGLGGAQRQVQDLGPLLERRGVRTAVVTRLVTPRSPRYERQPGLHVYRVPVPPGHAAASVAYTALGAGVVARFRPDVIHAHQLLSPTTIGLLAGEAVRVPVVATVLSTGPGGDVSRLLGNGLGAQRLRAIVSRVSMFICIADEIEQELLEHGVPPERMRRIPNGVDLAWFRPPAEGERERLRAQLGIPADATVALYCGRLAPVKRLHVLLDAVRDSQVHVLLVGEGSEEPRLREQARSRELAGRVHFHPKVEDTAPLFRAADVYASASEAEGMSISVLEAMASALPVATAPASGMSELLGGVGGVLARDPSAAALAAALGALADDPARREAAGRAARARVSERWSLDNTADMLVALYEELRRSRRRVAGSGPKRAA